MMPKKTNQRPINKITFREDLYPRFELDPLLVQQYAEDLEQLPPIEINQRDELIDGRHRWIAHKKKKSKHIAVTVTQTKSDNELLRLAIRRNATWGRQLKSEEKQSLACRLYDGAAGGQQLSPEEIADDLGVSAKSIERWVKTIKDRREKDRIRTIFNLWLACHTEQEIADELGEPQQTIHREVQELPNLDKCPKWVKVAALYEDDADWPPPIYDIWNFEKNENLIRCYGNTHVGIVDYLLYTFTKPFDIVVDPFGGGGSTIDICKKRCRRYWVSDRIAMEERPDMREIELAADKISLPARHADVKLVYLDPPYWKQAAGKYSKSPNDLANMSCEKFHQTLTAIIQNYGRKLKPGAHLACIISPTQWPNKDKSTTYHDIELAKRVKGKLSLVRRAICPYSTEQYNGTQVDIAKEKKLWLVLSRTLLIWERLK
jgi:DNA modification methylase/biotin operon repressor